MPVFRLQIPTARLSNEREAQLLTSGFLQQKESIPKFLEVNNNSNNDN
jgi:hypothetical protein